MRCVIYIRVSTTDQAERDGEEGFSLPAQREACIRHIRDQGWDLVDEYSDRGESARSADRPQLQAMLSRIHEQGDVDAVLVHKLDRLARNMEDHLAIRATLRQHKVTLVSITEKLEETASGKLVEGIHALMAEFYSANLASEVRKGMTQKAKMGGYPHRAPLGYLNVRETVGGRQVAHMVKDPERAHLITLAFERYATGDYTVEKLLEEMTARGLTSRGQKNYPSKPPLLSGFAHLLSNRVYLGIVEWNGIEAPGLHEPLVSSETFNRVQEILASRAARGTRERKHRHYLKGLFVCGVCQRKLSIQQSKGQYIYFYCLGQKDPRKPSGCRESYIAADVLEKQMEQLYQRVQLPTEWAERLRSELDAELTERQARNADERSTLARQLTRIETERHKVLEAYYASAIDVATLRVEQGRISKEAQAVEGRLQTADATLLERQEVLQGAMVFASNCGRAYLRGNETTRKLFNVSVFDRITVVNGKVGAVEYQEPFDRFFSSGNSGDKPVDGFEYRAVAGERGFEPLIG